MSNAYADPDTSTAHAEAFDAYNFATREFLNAISTAVTEHGLDTDQAVAIQRAGLELCEGSLKLGAINATTPHRTNGGLEI